jgi:hypothetical protein
VQTGVKEELLKALLEEQSGSTLKKARLAPSLCRSSKLAHSALTQIGDTVCELAVLLLDDSAAGWPELLSFLFQAVQQAGAKLREQALLIFASLSPVMAAQLAPHVPSLLPGAQRPHFPSLVSFQTSSHLFSLSSTHQCSRPASPPPSGP